VQLLGVIDVRVRVRAEGLQLGRTDEAARGAGYDVRVAVGVVVRVGVLVTLVRGVAGALRRLDDETQVRRLDAVEVEGAQQHLRRERPRRVAREGIRAAPVRVREPCVLRAG